MMSYIIHDPNCLKVRLQDLLYNDYNNNNNNIHKSYCVMKYSRNCLMRKLLIFLKNKDLNSAKK